jgi:glycosyltransferase involved in cell wall biosynthesis
MTQLVFWQNEPSLHMAPLVKALAALPNNDVHVITEWALSEDRRALGWSKLDHGRAKVHVCPNDASRRVLERTLAEGSHHVFSGLGAYPKTTGSLRALSAYRPAHIAVFSEPWNPYGIRKHARRVKFFLKSRSLDRVIDTYLLAGATALSQFVDLGVPKEKLFPFAYFVDQIRQPLDVSSPPTTEFAIVFVGKLEQRKNVSLLLRALSDIKRPWRLTIIGDGPSANELKATAYSLGISGRVHFLGAQDNEAARAGITSRICSSCPRNSMVGVQSSTRHCRPAYPWS